MFGEGIKQAVVLSGINIAKAVEPAQCTICIDSSVLRFSARGSAKPKMNSLSCPTHDELIKHIGVEEFPEPSVRGYGRSSSKVNILAVCGRRIRRYR